MLKRNLSHTAFAAAMLFGSAVAGELTVETRYPESPKLIRGKEIYPEFLLNMSRAADWARIGSTGGHDLRVTEVDCPGRPGERGLKFSAKIDKKSTKAPGWVAWQTPLSPELSLIGVDEFEFDLYPLQKFPFPVTARFGSTQGFGQLPSSWSDIIRGLESNRWHKVRIPVKKSRLSVDTMRFDFNARADAVPHQQEMAMIIAGIRFLPTPHPLTAAYSAGMKTAGAVSNGFIQNPNPLAIADDTALNYSVELAVTRQQAATLRLKCGEKTFSREITLMPPCTWIDIRLDNPVGLFGTGKRMLETVILTPEGEEIAGGVEAMPLEFHSSAAMEQRRAQLRTQYELLAQRHRKLEESGRKAALPGVSLTTAQLFLDHFIPDDFNRQKQYRIAMAELDDMEKLLQATDSELARYEQGSFRELPVLPFRPESGVTIQDGVIVQDGKPILLIGPLVGMPALSWSDYAARLGFNSVVVETDMNYWLNYERRKNDVTQKGSGLVPENVSYRGEDKALVDYLERCRKNGLAANLLLSSHYCREIPEDLSAARSPNAGHGNFDWDVLAPDAREAFRRMYGNLIPFLKDQPHLVSLGTANEPGYEVKADSQNFQAAFRDFLKEKYRTVTALNEAWGSNYSEFAQITLAEVLSPKALPAAKVEWTAFQSLKVNQFYGFLKELLLAPLPDKQVWVKLMGNIGYEMLDEEDSIALGQNVSGTDSAGELWQDHLRSMFPAHPVVNQEWHFVADGYTAHHDYLAQRMYQGVTRGIQSANIWRGGRAEWDSKGHGHVESFARYPFGLNAIGRTSLKLQMHYPVLHRFQNLNGGAIRLYFDKKAHLIQGKEYLNSIQAAYDRLRINPEGVRFTYPGKELSGVKLVAFGTLSALPQAAADSLVKWVEAGGTVWIDAPATWRDYAGDELVLPAEFRSGLAKSGISAFGQGRIVVGTEYPDYVETLSGVTAWSDGRPNTGVECRILTDKAGNMEYLSIVNLKDAEQKIRLMNGRHPAAVTGTDVWNDAGFNAGAEIALSPFAVKLIRIDRR